VLCCNVHRPSSASGSKRLTWITWTVARDHMDCGVQVLSYDTALNRHLLHRWPQASGPPAVIHCPKSGDAWILRRYLRRIRHAVVPADAAATAAAGAHASASAFRPFRGASERCSCIIWRSARDALRSRSMITKRALMSSTCVMRQPRTIQRLRSFRQLRRPCMRMCA
jgi:hypothetical protein